MRTNVAKFLAALALVFGLAASAAQPAAAWRRGGVAAGIAVGTLLGLGIAGAYAGPRYYPYAYPYGPGPYGPGCYRGPRHCEWGGRSCWYNRFGEYVCGGGGYHCWHPTYCN